MNGNPASLSGRLVARFFPTECITSKPIKSIKPYRPVGGRPIGFESNESISSNEIPFDLAIFPSCNPFNIKKQPILFPIKFTVSFPYTTPLLKTFDKNILSLFIISLLVFSPGINSHSFITSTGLKKCVMQTFFNNSSVISFVISFKGIPDVFELTIELAFLCSSIFLKISLLILISSTTTSHIQS